ncbi:tol-pal system-associated acyl-CoA thioesterase [Parvularcula sp. LCG005]|uniref:tol-pal system-associated acyl-CoA thioesterase n=1 Tax=Parvularcula sp. LCG005 TaxID=3078805 RepID=UPI00294399A4|nr:tol-pal system-associated acyl-CoA thioesterase [Parvularcula sp. LCG005]WOI52812.1 tol-pal system-associated acyl-CoA thioesterase [Parvularcula sp. LCG005]
MEWQHEVRVYFEDTDFSGVVYHAAYLKFFERARTEALRQTGLDHRTLIEAEPPTALTVRHLSIDYFKPARIDDLLTIRTQTAELRGARLVFLQTAFLDEEKLTEARVTIACMDMAGRPRRLPRHIATRLGAVSGDQA